MSKFEGGNKVRCVDCSRLSGAVCSAKGSKVSIKKRRSCGRYVFGGEFVNRCSADAVYVPHVDPKTRRLMRKLMKMGVLPDGQQSPVPAPPSGGSIEPLVEVANPAAFKTTATAQIPVVAPLESVGESVHGRPGEEEIAIWTPEDKEGE